MSNLSVHLLSLGCPKNSVDSRELLRGFKAAGIKVVDDPAEAGILAVNTCGFIEDAKRESIEEILRLAGLAGKGKALLVFGCLVERFRDDLLSEIPEIDAIFGIGETDKIINYCLARAGGKPEGGRGGVQQPDLSILGPEDGPSFRYLTVSDGCSRRCTYCVIPRIRGPHRSRPEGGIIDEARAALEAGARELVLIAQDITAYGAERSKGSSEIARLVRALGGLEVPGAEDYWVRLLYLHPSGLCDELIDAVAEVPNMAKYLDIPLQHSEDRVLKAMGRAGGTRKQYERLLRRVRRRIPGVALRTSMIVGFPGETEEDFRGLLDFVDGAGFEHLGAFKYSSEEGTPAAALPRQVPEEVKTRRWEELTDLQAGISLECNSALVGRTMRVLIDEIKDTRALGRTYRQAPGIDGITVVSGGEGGGGGDALIAGTFVEAEITGASEYDLKAVLKGAP